MKEKLLGKIEDKSVRIGIIGLGYVGLPLMLRFAQEHYSTLGFDIDEEKVRKLYKGESYFKHIPHENVRQALENGMQATTDFSRIQEMDAIIICVPTPLNEYWEPDLQFIRSTMEAVSPHMRSGQVISLESTSYPGTTEEELLAPVEQKGFTAGKDYFVLYSPEREDPGNKLYNTKTIPKVCGGVTENCLEVGKALYGSIIDEVVPVKSTRIAEMTKLLENIHRAVNIGLVNEMKMVADRMGIDINEVIEAAATKPFGFVPYYPGPGLGGHCIPIDPFYLTWKAKEYGINTRFIELAGEINRSMPEWVVDKTAEGLNAHRKPVNGSSILVLGISYKKNIDDMRESPAVEIMSLLTRRGGEVQYSDPYIPHFPKMRKYDFDLESIELTEERLRTFDAVIIATDHDDFDYEMILKNAPMIVDTRGRYDRDEANVIKA